MRMFTQQDNGALLSIADDRFGIVLECIPGAGYQWEIIKLPKGVQCIGNSLEDHDAHLLQAGVPKEVLDDDQLEQQLVDSFELVGGVVKQIMVFQSQTPIEGWVEMSRTASGHKHPSDAIFCLHFSPSVA